MDSILVVFYSKYDVEIGEEATIEQIGPPDKVISAFGPEVIGENVEGKVLRSEVAEHEGRTYYQFELEPPHVMITATAAGNRLYLFNVTGNGKNQINTFYLQNICYYKLFKSYNLL